MKALCQCPMVQSRNHAITQSCYHAMVGVELVFARHTKTTYFILYAVKDKTMTPTIDTILPSET